MVWKQENALGCNTKESFRKWCGAISRERSERDVFFSCEACDTKKNKTNKLRSRAHGSSTSNQWLIATVKVLTGLDKKNNFFTADAQGTKGCTLPWQKLRDKKTIINEIAKEYSCPNPTQGLMAGETADCTCVNNPSQQVTLRCRRTGSYYVRGGECFDMATNISTTTAPLTNHVSPIELLLSPQCYYLDVCFNVMYSFLCTNSFPIRRFMKVKKEHSSFTLATVIHPV